jgi:hypothetical protein
MKRFVCPDCGTTFKYPPRRAGKTVHCGGCGRSVTLATATPAVTAAAAARTTRWLRLAVIGVLVIGVGTIGFAHFWAMKTGADKEAAGAEVERLLGDVGPFAAVRPADEREVDRSRMVRVDIDRPGFGPPALPPGKVLVLDVPGGKVARRITGGLRPARQARQPDEVKYVAHVTDADKVKTADGYEYQATVVVYQLPERRVLRLLRFTKAGAADKSPKEVDDRIAAYLNE